MDTANPNGHDHSNGWIAWEIVGVGYFKVDNTDNNIQLRVKTVIYQYAKNKNNIVCILSNKVL